MSCREYLSGLGFVNMKIRSALSKKLFCASSADEMDDSELFDVFSIDNNPEPIQKIVQGEPRESLKKPKKLKTEESVAKETKTSAIGVNKKRTHDNPAPKDDPRENNESDETTHSRVSKKSRGMTDNPVVVDSFETESDQIIPATQGLQGLPVADHNIIIKKRVPPISKILK